MRVCENVTHLCLAAMKYAGLRLAGACNRMHRTQLDYIALIYAHFDYKVIVSQSEIAQTHSANTDTICSVPYDTILKYAVQKKCHSCLNLNASAMCILQ